MQGLNFIRNHSLLPIFDKSFNSDLEGGEEIICGIMLHTGHARMNDKLA